MRAIKKMIYSIYRKFTSAVFKPSVDKEVLLGLKELVWANIYHDSIRGIDYLEKLPLNIGRMAGNYVFFYLLNRILRDMKPAKILELGLGESSKFISAYLDNYLLDTKHVIIEQSPEWITSFERGFRLSNRSTIKHLPIEVIKKQGFDINTYKNFNQEIREKYDLYIIDGPIGSARYSRIDGMYIIDAIEVSDKFVIMFDDTHRCGEQDTLEMMSKKLRSKNIQFYMEQYVGVKSVTLIVSLEFKYFVSL